MAFHAAYEVGGDEGYDPAFLGLDHVLAEGRQRHARRAALVDQRGDAGMHAREVRVEAEPPGHVLEDVAMRVDEARENQLARDVHHLFSRGRKDAGGHRSDLAVLDGDIEQAVDVLHRVDHPAAAQQ